MSQPARTEAGNTPENLLGANKNRGALLLEQLPRFAIWIILLALMLIAIVRSPQVLNAQYLSTQLKQYAPLGVVAVGQTFVLLAAGIDLSVASVMALMSVTRLRSTSGRSA